MIGPQYLKSSEALVLKVRIIDWSLPGIFHPSLDADADVVKILHLHIADPDEEQHSA